MIYLIEKLWIDPMENHNAHGYSVHGYVETLDDVIKVCSQGREFTKKDCWSLGRPTPEFQWSALDKLEVKP